MTPLLQGPDPSPVHQRILEFERRASSEVALPPLSLRSSPRGSCSSTPRSARSQVHSPRWSPRTFNYETPAPGQHPRRRGLADLQKLNPVAALEGNLVSALRPSLTTIPPGPLPLGMLLTAVLMVFSAIVAQLSVQDVYMTLSTIAQKYHIDDVLAVVDELYEGYDDLWDKCDKWRRIPNATEADAPFACSMRVPLSTLGFWALHAGLPFCCLAPLFVLWLAIYARKLYIGRVGDAVSQRRLRIDTNGSTVDASMATQNVVYATTIGGTLVGVTVAVAAVFFGLSALGYRLLVYPIPAHQVCGQLVMMSERGFSTALRDLSSAREAEAEAARYDELQRALIHEEGGIAGCESALRLRGCGALAAHLCYRFGDVMDVVYWVAPRAYIATPGLDDVCAATASYTESVANMCVLAEGLDNASSPVYITREELLPHALKAEEDFDALIDAAYSFYEGQTGPSKFSILFANRTGGLSIADIINGTDHDDLVELCSQVSVLEGHASLLFYSTAALLVAALLAEAYSVAYSHFVLLWELCDISRGVPRGALYAIAAIFLGFFLSLHAAGEFFSVRGALLDFLYKVEEKVDVLSDDVLFNPVTNSSLRPPSNEDLFRLQRQRLSFEVGYLLLLGLAVTFLGLYARSRYARDGMTVQAVSALESFARFRGVPSSVIEIMKPLLSVLRSVVLTVVTWGGLLIALLDVAFSYKLVQYALIVPGLLLPMLTRSMLDQPLCHDVAHALRVPMLASLGAHSSDSTFRAGATRMVELIQGGEMDAMSNGQLLADDAVRPLVVQLSEIRLHESCADTAHVTTMLSRAATTCIKLPHAMRTVRWLFHAMVPSDDDKLRCPSDASSPSVHERIDHSLATIEGTAVPCAALVDMLHVWQHFCALGDSETSPMDTETLAPSYWSYQPNVDASYVYLYSGGDVEQDERDFLSTPRARILVDLARQTSRFSLALVHYLDELHPERRVGQHTDGVAAFLNTTADLVYAPDYVEPVCTGIWRVQWVLIKFFLAAMIWFGAVIALASRRAKYSLMDTLASLKERLASNLDSDHDGTLEADEKNSAGKGLVALMSSQFKGTPAMI